MHLDILISLLITIDKDYVKAILQLSSAEPIAEIKTMLAAKSDREPASISLDEIAETNAFNANVCWQGREQTLVWQIFIAGFRRLKNEVL